MTHLHHPPTYHSFALCVARCCLPCSDHARSRQQDGSCDAWLVKPDLLCLGQPTIPDCTCSPNTPETNSLRDPMPYANHCDARLCVWKFGVSHLLKAKIAHRTLQNSTGAILIVRVHPAKLRAKLSELFPGGGIPQNDGAVFTCRPHKL